MFRMISTAILGLFTVALAQAHFPFIVPEADGAKVKVVFSDTLEPDTNVNIEKLTGTKLTLRDASGKESPLEWSKGAGFYLVNVPGSGPRMVFGITDYGVLQKGEGKPFRLVYHPKAVLGDLGRAATLGDRAAFEIVSVGDAGKVKFQVLASGKPLADCETTVLLPGGKKSAVKTDADGFTPAFEQTGRFGVYAKRFEAKSGEHAGQKYDEVRHYATLVADIGPGK